MIDVNGDVPFLDTFQDVTMLNIETLDRIESFVLFACQEDLKKQAIKIVSNLLSFLSTCLSNSKHNSAESLKAFRILRFFRLDCLGNSEINRIEEFALDVLTKFSGEIRFYAFALLRDYFLQVKRTDYSHFQVLFQFCKSFIQNCEKENIEFASIVIHNIDMFVHTNQITNVTEFYPLIFDKVRYLLSFANSPEFLDGPELLVRKLLKLMVRFFSNENCNTPIIYEQYLQVINDISTMIPDNIRFTQIYTFFLLLISIIIEKNPQNNTELIFNNVLRPNMIENYPLFTFPPFATSKRHYIAIGFLANYMQKKDIKEESMLKFIWPLLFTPKCLKAYFMYSSSLIQAIFASKRKPDDRSFGYNIMEQIIGCFNILIYDFKVHQEENRQNEFVVDVWADSAINCTKLLYFVLQTEQQENPNPSILYILRKYTEFIVFVIDVMGATLNPDTDDITIPVSFLKYLAKYDFSKKLLPIIKIFCTTIGRLQYNVKQVYLMQNLELLLPTKKYHVSHKNINISLFKSIHQSILYEIAFFSLINRKFDKIFKNPVTVLLHLVILVFKEAFATDERVQNFLTAPESTFNDLASFIWKILASQDIQLIELLLSILPLLFPMNEREKRLPKFGEQVRRTPNLMLNVLMILGHKHGLKEFTGLLALLFFPLCQPGSAEKANEWTCLFFYALESDKYLYEAVRNLFNDTSKMFPYWIKQIKKDNRMQLISLLSASLSKLPPSKISVSRSLLARVPQCTSKTCMIVERQKKGDDIVEIDGFEMFPQSILESAEKGDEEDKKEILVKLFNALRHKLNEYEILKDKYFQEAAQKIHEIDPKFIEEICQTTESQSELYPMLLMKTNLTESVDISRVEDNKEFCSFCCMFCNSQVYSKCAILNIRAAIKDIPVSPIYIKICSALVHASLYDYKDVKDTLIEDIFTANWDVSSDNIKMLIRQLAGRVYPSVMMPIKKVRKISLLIFNFLEQKVPLQKYPPTHIYLTQVLKQFQSCKQHIQCIDKNDFILKKDFSNIAYPIDLCVKFIQAIQEIDVPYFPEPVENMIISSISYEEACKVTTIRFFLKIIAKTIPYTVSQSAFTIYDMAFALLRKEKYTKFIPFFIKQLKKQDQTKMPTELTSYVAIQQNGLPEVPAKYSDALLIEMAVGIKGFTRVNEVRTWISNSFASLCTNKLVSYQDRKTIKVLIRILKLIIKDDRSKATLEVLLQFINVSAYSSVMHFGLEEFPLVELCLKYPISMTDCFIFLFRKKWRPCFYIMMMELIKIPALIQFRNNFISYIDRRSEETMQLLKALGSNMFNFAISLGLNEFAENINQYEDLNVKSCVSIILKFLQYLEFCPSQYFSIISILFATKNAKEYKFESELYFRLIGEVLPIIIQRADFFFQPSFLDVFAEFIKSLPEDSRSGVHSAIVAMTNSGAIGKERAFIYAICNCSCDALNLTAEDISCDLTNASRDFSSMVCLNFAYKLGMKGMNFVDPIFHKNGSSLAYSIQKGTGSYSQITDIKRIVNSVRLLPKGTDVNKELTETVLSLLDHVPYSSNLTRLAYNLFECKPEFIDFNNQELAKYILVLQRTILRQRGNSYVNNEIYLIPQMLRPISHDITPEWNDAILEFFLKEMELFFKTNERMIYIQYYVSELKPFIERKSPTFNIDSTFSLIREKMYEPIPQSLVWVDYTVMLKIFAELGKYFVKKDDPIPPIFTPSRTMIPYIRKEHLALLKKSIETIDETVGLVISRKLVEAYYSELKTEIDAIIQPQKYPFATVAQWLSQSVKSRIYNNILTLFQALAPHNFLDFVNSVKAIEDPFIPEVLTYIRKICKERFWDKYSNYLETNPATLFFYTKKSDNLISDLWSKPWIDIPRAYHLRLFANMVLPEWFGEISDYIPEEEIKKLVTITTLKMEGVEGFNRWCMYYNSLKTDSKLSAAFWSANCFKGANPIPLGTVFENREYLNKLNHCNDALGLVKTEIPELFNAATYHQLSNYEAAKNEYINAMDEHPDTYFFSLLELKQVSYNIDIIKAPSSQQNQMRKNYNIYSEVFKVLPSSNNSKSPGISLPFFINYSSSHEIKSIVSHVCNTKNFTTFLSQTYLPYFTRSSLAEEVYKDLNILHDRNLALNASMQDLVSPWKVTWMNTLDKLNATLSTICWRLTIINIMMKQQPPHDTVVALQGASKTIHMKLAQLLQKAGSIREGIKQLRFSDTCEVNFKVDEASIGRVQRFLASADPNEFQRIRYEQFIALHDFRGITMLDKMPNFSRVTHTKWITCILEMFSKFSNFIQPKQVIDLVANEIRKVGEKKCHYYYVLLIELAKKDPQCTPYINQRILVDDQTEEMKRESLTWLPMLIKYCGNLSVNFLRMLARKNGMHIIMTLKTMETWNNCDRESMERISTFMKTDKFGQRAITNFYDTFSWLKNCQEDIRRMDISVKAHKILLKMMDDEEVEVDAEVEKEVGGKSFEEIADFCEKNPPVFKTDNRNTNFFSTAGVKLSYINRPISSIFINANGKEEASLGILVSQGSILYNNILSSQVYPFTYQQSMFNEIIKKHVQGHMSNIPRANFLPFLFAFSIHPSLIIVHVPKSTSMQSALQQKMVQQLRRRKEIQSDGSPFARKERSKAIKKSEIAELRNWFIRGSEGHYVDYLTVRQVFASSLAFSCAMNVLFKSDLCDIPNLFITSNKQHVMLPGYFFNKEEDKMVSVPLTESILWFIPKFVLNGSFTTTFLSTFESLYKHKRKFKAIISVLREGMEGGGGEDESEELFDRLKMLTPAVSQDSEKTFEEFPFAVVDHLISEASNRNTAFNSFFWI